jgi:Flp pilus assembly protein TadD
MIDDAAGNRESASRGYRRVLELQPDSVIALNNLAYNLAVYQHDAAAAKPFAERAVDASKRNPTIVDTLAWTEHLLGNDGRAATLLQEAMRGAPENADIQLHAAFVAAAQGSRDTAETRLREALRLNPVLQQREDVQALQSRLRSAH